MEDISKKVAAYGQFVLVSLSITTHVVCLRSKMVFSEVFRAGLLQNYKLL